MGNPDLNLVRTFVTVYETGSVTAAAAALHLSQPTVTHALNKLRRQMGDELFVRSRTGVTATAAARRAYPALVEALNRIEQTLAVDEVFDPAHAGPTTFDLAMSDAGEVSVLPYITTALRQAAPRSALRVAPLDVEHVEGQLVRGELDCFVSSAVFTARRIAREIVFRERYVVLLADDHPRIGASVRAGALDREPHVSVQGVTGHQRPYLLQEERGVRVVLRIPRFTALPYVLPGSDAVAIVPGHVAEVLVEGHHLRQVELPWTLDEIEISLYARHPHSRSPEQAWFMALVHAALSDRYGLGDNPRV